MAGALQYRSEDRAQETSGWAVGVILFAAIMMIMVGIFQFVAGLIALFNSDFYIVTRDYIFQFDATTWGWIHLVLGMILGLAGFGLLAGQTWARVVGIILAVLSAITNFLFIPYYPFWSLLIVALDIIVIFSITIEEGALARPSPSPYPPQPQAPPYPSGYPPPLAYAPEPVPDREFPPPSPYPSEPQPPPYPSEPQGPPYPSGYPPPPPPPPPAGYAPEPVPDREFPPPVERFVDVVHPESVRPGVAFTLAVALLRMPPEQVPDAEPVPLVPTVDEEGKPTGAPPVTVVLNPSDAFVVDGPTQTDLAVLPDRDTTPFEFRLLAQVGVSGPHSVNVIFWQAREVIGELVALVKVEAYASMAPLLHASFRVMDPLVDDRSTPPPDVIINVNRVSSQGKDRLVFSYQWVAQDWPMIDAGSVELLTSAEAWAAMRYENLSQFARSDRGTVPSGKPGSPGPSERQLEQIGENLYYHLFTDDLKAFYQQCADSTRSILIFSNEPWIPWEVIKPWGGDLPEGTNDFLCARFQLSRWYYSRAGQRLRPGLAISQLGPVIPQKNLQAVDREARYLQSLPQTWPPLRVAQPLPVRPQDVLRLMEMGETNLFHFATHGLLDAGSPTLATISLQWGVLRVEDLIGDKIVPGLRRAAPLVVMNACHSSRQALAISRPDGWVERFLEFGCSGFIGANWEVDDALAADFAIGLYDALRSGETLAGAVWTARAAIRQAQPGNSTWLAYSLFGHPNITIHAE
jgi:CHAT domain